MNFDRGADQSIGLGCWQLAGPWGNTMLAEDAVDLVSYAHSLGVRVFDTALEYGNGSSERAIASAISIDDGTLVITKVPPKDDVWSPASSCWQKSYPPEWVRSCVVQSRVNLQCNKIPVVLLHTWCADWDLKALDSLRQLKSEGICKFIGVSVPDQVPESALEIAEKIDFLELSFNVSHQNAAQYFDEYNRAGVRIIVRSPMGAGALACLWGKERSFAGPDWRGKWVAHDWLAKQIKNSRTFSKLCEKYDIAPPHAALRFILSFPQVFSVIPGATKRLQVAQNLASMSISVPPDFFKEATELWEAGFLEPVYYGGGDC